MLLSCSRALCVCLIIFLCVSITTVFSNGLDPYFDWYSGFEKDPNNDFFGDGTGAILYCHPQGSDFLTAVSPENFPEEELKAGFFPIADPDFVPYPKSYEFGGSGDFDGNGSDDILWIDKEKGFTLVWLSNVPDMEQPFIGLAPGAEIVTIADFDNDGVDDLLYRDVSDPMENEHVIVYINANLIPKGQPVTFNTNKPWFVIAAGDFNGDNIADLLWKSEDFPEEGQEEIVIYLLNMDGSVQDTQSIQINNDVWIAAGIGDFWGDNTDDIVWIKYLDDNQYSVQVVVWDMDGFERSGYVLAEKSNFIPVVNQLNAGTKADIYWVGTKVFHYTEPKDLYPTRLSADNIPDWLNNDSGGSVYDHSVKRSDVHKSWAICPGQ